MVAITESEFRRLAEFIKANYGIHLKDEKQTLVTGRLGNVLERAGFESFTDYYNHLIADRTGAAVATLIDKITTNHTFFMREADHFQYFREFVLPWLASTVHEKDLRIWCAACSSGEESYTLAMILDEFFGKERFRWDTKVLATDISEQVLSLARKGIYSNERLSPLSASWKSRYLRPYDAENSMIVDKIKSEVVYRSFNLMDNLPFRRKFHVIFCRNVMIYFDNQTKLNLVNRFYDHLEYGGYLFIGHSESLNREMTKFQYIAPAIYRKI